MKGLDLARAYFEAFGMPMLKEQFPHLLPFLAAGLTGSGSECFGYDDEVSQDHDFAPGFCLFLPGEETVSRQEAFRLERAYSRLPREYMGFTRSLMQPVGGPRHGVLRSSDFFREKTGAEDGILTVGQWLTTPDPVFAEATNGAIFYDGPGDVTRIRQGLASYPEDIRRKKLAAHLLLMAQSGPYNYVRCLRHGETGGAQLAVTEFVRHGMQTVFLLNRVYMPYYKWAFRAMRSLPRLSLLAEVMEYLLTTGNDPDMAEEKRAVMDGIAEDVIAELQCQALTKAGCDDLEKHAYSVQDGITDGDIRNLHIMEGA
ncbi:MAG: DUF4037 domain-containing protein [Clostridia bacterium]|nr:DUF4037 domain-containing protein [Clostridia bacterium]